MCMLFEITVYRCILENVSSSHISTINCKHLIFHIFWSQQESTYIHINLFDLYMFIIQLPNLLLEFYALQDGAFEIPISAVLPKYDIEVPEVLNFNMCAAKDFCEATFEVKNSG